MDPIDILPALLAITAVIGCLVAIAVHAFGRQASHVAGMFRAEDLGWPRGVQEEDPPPIWQPARRPPARQPAARPAIETEPATPAPARIAVRASGPRRVVRG
jgi:hypothetical protein